MLRFTLTIVGGIEASLLCCSTYRQFFIRPLILSGGGLSLWRVIDSATQYMNGLDTLYLCGCAGVGVVGGGAVHFFLRFLLKKISHLLGRSRSGMDTKSGSVVISVFFSL